MQKRRDIMSTETKTVQAPWEKYELSQQQYSDALYTSIINHQSS